MIKRNIMWWRKRRFKSLLRQGKFDKLEKAGRKLGAVADELLRGALCHDSSSVRQRAAKALGFFGDVRAVEPLTVALDDDSHGVRKAAVGALGKIGDVRAVESLIERLDDEFRVVRIAALKALGEIGDARAAEPIRKCISDSNSNVQKAAQKALYKVAPADTAHQEEHVVLSSTIDDMEPMMRAGAAFGTLQYDGGLIEPFYERMSRDLISEHGPLVGVDYVSHFPKFEIWFSYEDGTRLYSGQRTGHYDIHFMSLGYVGEGPRYARHFLAAAGFDLTSEQIESIEPGDSIQLKDGKAVIVREEDKVVESDEVTFDREVKGVSMGFPATSKLYKGPNKAAAMSFLEKQNITAQSYFVGVKTPEGTFCKDRMGLFDAPTPNWPE